jgi:hypothetical protein
MPVRRMEGPHRKGAQGGRRDVEDEDKEWRSTALTGGTRAHNTGMSINIAMAIAVVRNGDPSRPLETDAGLRVRMVRLRQDVQEGDRPGATRAHS